MKTFLLALFAVLLGLLLGGAVNMGLILLSSHVIPPPEGVDNTTMEGLAAGMALFEPKHFLFPFLAHALGTVVGALVAGLLSPGRSPMPSAVVGVLFLAGGITNVLMLPSPLWFTVLDLGLAYLPAAWLGWVLARRLRPRKRI